MKVGELFAIISQLDPKAEVILSVNGGPEGRFKDIIENEHARRQVTVRCWGNRYQTREVGNAYGCNDDRYGGSVLCIEVGELSE